MVEGQGAPPPHPWEQIPEPHCPAARLPGLELAHRRALRGRGGAPSLHTASRAALRGLAVLRAPSLALEDRLARPHWQARTRAGQLQGAAARRAGAGGGWGLGTLPWGRGT